MKRSLVSLLVCLIDNITVMQDTRIQSLVVLIGLEDESFAKALTSFILVLLSICGCSTGG